MAPEDLQMLNEAEKAVELKESAALTYSKFWDMVNQERPAITKSCIAMFSLSHVAEQNIDNQSMEKSEADKFRRSTTTDEDLLFLRKLMGSLCTIYRFLRRTPKYIRVLARFWSYRFWLTKAFQGLHSSFLIEIQL